MSYTKKLAKYSVDLKYEDLPKEVVHQAKRLTMHTLGVSLAGSSTPPRVNGRSPLPRK